MNRRQMMMLPGVGLFYRRGLAQNASAQPDTASDTPDKILLKDYRPKSIYKIPKTEIIKAKHPIIDVHCHGVRPAGEMDAWLKTMDTVGVEKAVIFTGASTGERFAEVIKAYTQYTRRFDLWCSFDLSGVNDPGFGLNALKSLEDCHRLGAVGVGETSDKGRCIGGRGGGRGGRGAASNAAAPAGAVTNGPHALDDYHWPLNGFGLPDPILKKVYSDNARRAFQRAKANAG